jgi:hypothetical protein
VPKAVMNARQIGFMRSEARHDNVRLSGLTRLPICKKLRSLHGEVEMSDDYLDLIFRKARTHSAWLNKPVDDNLLRQVYDLAKLGPTSANMCPLRIIFVKSREAKERLRPALSAGNADKTMAAPVPRRSKSSIDASATG